MSTIARQYFKGKDDLLMMMVNLSRADKLVLAYLAERSGYSGEANVTQKEVAAKTKLGVRTVAKSYATLKAAGFFATGGHRMVVFNPEVFMRGKEKGFMWKLERYREALNGKPAPSKEVVAGSKAYLESMVPSFDDAEEETVEGWADVELGF